MAPRSACRKPCQRFSPCIQGCFSSPQTCRRHNGAVQPTRLVDQQAAPWLLAYLLEQSVPNHLVSPVRNSPKPLDPTGLIASIPRVLCAVIGCGFGVGDRQVNIHTRFSRLSAWGSFISRLDSREVSSAVESEKTMPVRDFWMKDEGTNTTEPSKRGGGFLQHCDALYRRLGCNA
jgi:hypothetical protein